MTLRVLRDVHGKVRISAPVSVTRRVCSNCAVRDLSLVVAVQPSSQRSYSYEPRVSIGYPDPAAELTMLDEHASAEPLYQLRPVADARSVQAAIEAVRQVRVAHEVRQSCVDLVTDTAEDFYSSFEHRTFSGFRIYPS